MNRIFLLLSLVFLPLVCQAQTDTSITFNPVEVKASPIRQAAIGGESETWTKSEIQSLSSNTIADLLHSETGIFIKSYGLGSLATSSIRGASASHTLVLWNGLPIHSPMLGLLDLSLLPSNIAEKVEVQYGGASAMWGSGAIGGSIALNNVADFSKKLKISSQSSLGSFGTRRQALQLGLGNERFQSLTKFNYDEADNDFLHEIHPDLPKHRQTNAHLLQYNFLQDIYFQINSNQRLSTHVWWQSSSRQIPPTIVQNESQAYQDDKALRLSVNWQKIKSKSVWNAKLGYFKEHLDYYDPQILLTALSDFSTWMGEFDAQFSIDKKEKHKLALGTMHSLNRAFAAGYQAKHPIEEYRAAIFGSYQGAFGDWTTQLSLRQEAIGGKLIPLTPVLAVERNIGKQLTVKAKISKNYRLPTLNDRFWQPGGNPDLKPESGWSEEATIAWIPQNKEQKISGRVALTGFNRNIHNWILWSRLEGQSFWSSNNIAEVWSRGLEARLQFAYQSSTILYQLKGSYHLTRSTNQVTLEFPKISAGQQLFYTPQDQFTASLSAYWRGFYAAYQHRFVGSSLGINEDLEAYHLGQLRLRYDWKFKKMGGNLSFAIDNIWNESYFVIERRPMAGRFFRIGLNFEF